MIAMDRREFLKGLAAAAGLAVVPAVFPAREVDTVTAADGRPMKILRRPAPWSADRLVVLHAIGRDVNAQRSALGTVWLKRAGGEHRVAELMFNTLGALQWSPPDVALIGSDVEVFASSGVMAAAIFQRPDGTHYRKDCFEVAGP
jgi:hypothetical protein